jgi:2-polyprenyl-6-methoxyphenol hydroxylase-like FAD-dependent oxidoreductase
MMMETIMAKKAAAAILTEGPAATTNKKIFSLRRALGRRRAPALSRGFDRRQRQFFSSSSLRENRGGGRHASGPIVIVGGGPCGLLMSLYLSKYRVPSLLFERHALEERYRHPQAHFLNTRTMELLRFDFPAVYRDVVSAMRPAAEWSDFVFCTSVFGGHRDGGGGGPEACSHVLARVRHPVSRPLAAGRDANGLLVPLGPPPSEDPSSSSPSSSGRDAAPGTAGSFLSTCSVGHLAQHELCRILHRHAAGSAGHGYGELRYGRAVTGIELGGEDGGLAGAAVVHACDSSSVRTPLVVAADGSRSLVRGAAGIRQAGRGDMQHLVNVHVSVDPDVSSRRHLEAGNYGMLYSIFSPEVIAMVVCHDASRGEYVVQVPYFPPYQTLEDDFGPSRLQDMLCAIFGPRVPPSSLRVRSVRPWTMGSLVSADFHQSSRLALVGDAAHAFPPSGGLGMNTGLQDVQNLAWRVARDYHHWHRQRPDHPGKVAVVGEATLRAYQRERQAVAKQNAALSTRNYRRLLGVHRSLHLNDRHPDLLARALEAAPVVPLAAKRFAFRSAFRAALQPLSALQQPAKRNAVRGPSQLYRDHVVRSLRRILESGAGLPLLFPKYELGFGYDAQGGSKEQRSDDPQHPGEDGDWTSDTWADQPTLRVGYLVPHVRAKLVSFPDQEAGSTSRFPRLVWIDEEEVDDAVAPETARGSSRTLSTSNLPSQLTPADGMPAFVLLVVGSLGRRHIDVARIAEELADRLRLEVQVAQILNSSSSLSAKYDTDKSKEEASSHWTSSTRWPQRRLVLQEIPSAFSFFPDEAVDVKLRWSAPYFVLVRPDSHVHGVSSLKARDENSLVKALLGPSAD